MNAENSCRFYRISYVLLLGLLAVVGAVCLAWALCNPAWLKSFFDGFSPDGNFERLTSALLTQLRPLAWLLAAFSLGLFLLFFLRPTLWAQFLAWSCKQWLSLRADRRAFIEGLCRRLSRRDLWLDVFVLLLLAALLRFVWLERPLEHDEAFTYYVFGRLPLRFAMSDYSFPNNHILHTLLLKLCVAGFGNHSWAMRLPAFVFGAAVAPLLYLFARYSTHRRWPAFLAGFLLALYPYSIQYSVNARGYSLMAAFTLLAALLALAAMQYKNRLLWLLFSLVIVAGLYTLPIMILPAGGLFTWLLICGLRHGFTAGYGRRGWLKAMFASGVLIVLLTVLLYLPVVQASGLNSLIANPNVAPLNASEFLPTLGDRLKDTWREWQAGLPLWVSLPAVIMLLPGIIFYEKKSRAAASLFAGMLIFLAVYTALEKPNLWPRVTYYLIPLLMLALAFGLSGLWQMLSARLTKRAALPAWLILPGVALAAALILIHAPNYSPIGPHNPGETETLAQAISTRWQADTIILIDYPEDMPFMVYMERFGLPASAVRWEQPFRGAYVIINKPEKQSIISVIDTRGPELAFFDIAAATLLEDLPNSSLYYVPSHWELVQEEYEKAAESLVP
jgi:hypothetical protein